MFKLIIAGGRDFNNYDGMSKCLDRLLKNINDNIEIVSEWPVAQIDLENAMQRNTVTK